MIDKRTRAMLAVIGIAYLMWALNTPDKGTLTDNAVGQVVAKGDLFEGKITNMNANIKPEKLLGTGVYDRNCVNIGNGLTDCHAGIQTKEYGLLDFNHVHNKAIKPCIVQGDEVVVEILDSGGNAKVQRIYPASKAAEQETEEMTGR